MAIKFNRSQTFATNGTVTAPGLHNLVDGLDIYQALITDQTNLTSVGSADELLIADADLTAGDAPRAVTVNELFEDALTISTYTNANINNISYGTSTGTRLVSTNASITTGTIPSLTSSTASITIGTIPTLTAGTTTSTAVNITNGTIQTLTSSTANISSGSAIFSQGTVTTLNSTTGTISNLSTTLAGDFTISQGTGTLGTTGVTAGTYGTSTAAVTLTLDAKGRVTTVSTSAISSTPADGSVTPAKLSQPPTLGTAQNTTSGTAIDFTGIPNWARIVTVMLNGVSTNGTSEVILQIGDSDGVETSGYLGAVAQLSNTAVVSAYNFSSSIRVDGGTNAAAVRHGAIRISLINPDSNLWSFDGSIGRSDAATCSCLGGIKSLSTTLDRIRLTTEGGTNTFDAGSVNIFYQG